jgi:hypothetical protein
MNKICFQKCVCVTISKAYSNMCNGEATLECLGLAFGVYLYSFHAKTVK